MLSPRRALVIAAAVAMCILLFTYRSPFFAFPGATALSGAASSSRSALGHAAKAVAHSKTTAGGPEELANGPMSKQKPMKGPGKTLVDRLRFQYPYDPTGKFPAFIWQTWKDSPSSGKFAEGLRPQEASWTEKHPGFVHEVVTDDTAERLVRYLYASVPEVLEAYDAMPVPVLKADMFRYLILFARGGIYSDIDTEALKSAAEWLPKEVPASDVGLIVGIEADPDRPDWADWYSRRIQICQWTIQAKPGHPTLRNIIATITEDTLRMKRLGLLSSKRMDKSIVEFTGPAVWTDSIFDYFNDPAFFDVSPGARNITWEHFTGMTMPKKVGDVIVLPITSFSPGVMQMGAGELDDPMAFVKHDFEGMFRIRTRVKAMLNGYRFLEGRLGEDQTDH